jgi:putative acetyltransferase
MNARSQVVIRPLEAADVSAILEIIGGCRREYGLEGRVESILERADYAIHDVYQRERSRYLVADVDGDIAGGGGIAPLAGDDQRICELQRMYLRPANRRVGLGHALLLACVEEAKRFQFESCYLETISEMTTALSFYERHGFRRLEAPIGWTGHGHNDCWMKFNIATWYQPQEYWSM